MIRLDIFQVDAFTDRLFGGNPAAVIPLQTWLPDELMQEIAAENNLSETAFFVPSENGFHIRWFTPAVEVALCGHATLATSLVIFERLNYTSDTIFFESKSGILTVFRKDGMIFLDFPKQETVPATLPAEIARAFKFSPFETWKANDDYMLIFEKEEEIRDLEPDFGELKKVPARGIIVSAPGSQPGTDFVSRFFAPGSGIDEDPVTGSAHTKLVPYWAARLGKPHLTARQISKRSGLLTCENKGDRVLMGGHGKLFMEGSIYLEKI